VHRLPRHRRTVFGHQPIAEGVQFLVEAFERGEIGLALAPFLPEALVELGHFRQHPAGRRLEAAQVELEAQVVEFRRAAVIVAHAERQARIDPLRRSASAKSGGNL
jgi:hypothetical protein